MNQKNHWILWIALVVLGGLAAHFIFDGDDDHAVGPPPESGKWSCVFCPAPVSQDARDILDKILVLANGASLPAPQLKDIRALVGQCAVNVKPFGGTLSTHCGLISSALARAVANDWVGCIGDLTHGH